MAQRYDSKDDDRSESKDDYTKLKSDHKSEDKHGSASCSDEELVNRVKEYFFSDESLGQDLEAFAEKNVSIIDLDEIEANQYRLEYTDVYEQYRSMFESKIEHFISDTMNSTIPHFYSALSTKIENEPDGADAMFGELLLGVTNFDCFMMMMKDKAQEMRRK